MENQVIQVQQADMLQALNRAEIDQQVATAKQYPRHLPTVLNQIQTYATMDVDTASECFYVLHRNGAGGTTQTIEGLSVRMAEIIAGAWGNLRVATRIIQAQHPHEQGLHLLTGHAGGNRQCRSSHRLPQCRP